MTAARKQALSLAEGERLFKCHSSPPPPQRKAQDHGLNLCNTTLSQKSPAEDRKHRHNG